MSRCRRVVVIFFFCFFFLCFFCSSLVPTLRAQASDVQSAKTAKPLEVNVPANNIEPQIVRIRYLEGDVRIARGTKGAMWEAAVSGLPLETGYTLATGRGRAEIEFEDASTVYLGENSVVAFNDLLAADAVPITEISLLTGTVTLDIHPLAGSSFPGLSQTEVFALTTPTNRVLIKSPGVYERVTSYLDAMAVTPLESLSVSTPSMAGSAIEHQAKGKTTFYHADGPPTAADPATSENFTEWDRWVADRAVRRERAISAVMRASGLTTPIPGLADLYGNGTFFSCKPYGTCWEPADQAAKDASVRGASARTFPLTPASMSASRPVYGSRQASFHLVALGSEPQTGQATPPASPGQSAPPRVGPYRPYDDFPCYPPGIRTGLPNHRPYDWALCHAGSWIYQRQHYVWVAGSHKHHHCPVHWVKTGRTVAFVPIHPLDVHGKRPLNSQNEAFKVAKKGMSVERVSLNGGAKLKMLSEPPRLARGEYHQALLRAADPAPEIYRVGQRLEVRDRGLRQAGTRLTFNRHSQSFTVSKATMLANHNTAQLRSFSRSIGGLQSRPTGGGGRAGGSLGGGGGGHSGGRSSGGSSHAASSAGSSGGSSHPSSGGGGGASGGGGSHH